MIQKGWWGSPQPHVSQGFPTYPTRARLLSQRHSPFLSSLSFRHVLM